MSGAAHVDGYCPMGCGETLRLEGGWVMCDSAECPKPEAAHAILQDPITEHRVTFGTEGWTIRHPLQERIGDALVTCSLHQLLNTYGGPPPVGIGVYAAVKVHVLDTWEWELQPLDPPVGRAS